jgi:hypothetical protein
MGWYYKTPETFPIFYKEAYVRAVEVQEPSIVKVCKDFAEADVIAQTFRYYRWCIRKDKSETSRLYLIETTWDFRLKAKVYLGKVCLFVTAKPARLKSLIDLNPELDGIELRYNGSI